MSAYLFVHFREKATPDGEQIYFGVSRDGCHWKAVNEGRPVLWSYLGEKGVRDPVVFRHEKGNYFIIATDLSLAYSLKYKYHGSWHEVSQRGSQCLSLWESDDLLHFKPQRMLDFSGYGFGCMWAPDVIRPSGSREYILHWSSPIPGNPSKKAIFYALTRDFVTFSAPGILYEKEDSSVIDSALYEQDGTFYLFVKSEAHPETIIMLRSRDPLGPFERISRFDEEMSKLDQGKYEAPAAFRLPDGRWCLLLDYYGVPGKGQGYVPFVAETLESGAFIRSNAGFSFPYGFKHGTVLEISEETCSALESLVLDD